MVAALPAFDLGADPLHYRKAGLDSIGAGKRSIQPCRNPQFQRRERLFQAFGQASRGAGIFLKKLVVQFQKGDFGIRGFVHLVSRSHLDFDRVPLFFRQVFGYIANLMNLAPLNECGIAGIVQDGPPDRPATIHDVQSWFVELHPAFDQLAHQFPTTVAFSVLPCRNPSRTLFPSRSIPIATMRHSPLKIVPSIIITASGTCANDRFVSSSSFSLLASMKCSLVVLFSRP